MITQKNKKPIYRHDHLSQGEINRVKPLMESAFGSTLNGYTGSRKKIGEERLNFMSGLYANRLRVSGSLGVNPLNEDANIFGSMPQVKQLFESAGNITTTGNTLGMPEVSNPMSSNQVPGGIWNPGYKSGSGDIPSYLFGLQSHIAAFCIGFDLIPTIQVDTPKVLTQYIDTVYGGGPLDDAENQPAYVNLESKVFKKDFFKTTKAKRAETKLVIVGDENGDKEAMEVRFMMASAIRPACVVEVLSTGKFDSSTYTPENTKSVKDIIDAVNNSGKTSKIKYNDSGTYDGEVAIDTLKVDYASSIRDTIPQAATNDNSLKMSRAQHEKGPKNKLNVISLDKQFEIDGIEIDADTTNIKIKDMAAQGVNVIAELYNGVQNQLIQTIDYNILDHLYKLGVTNAYNTYQATGVNHSLYIAAPSKADIDFTAIDVEYEDILGNDVRSEMGKIVNSIQSSGYENQQTHADRFFARVLYIAEYVAQMNRLGTTDFMVTSGALTSMMKKNSKYSVSPTLNTLTQVPELHFAGTVYEVINVYKNPKIDFNDPRVLMGRRGDDTDPGAKFFAYDLAASRQTVVEGTMAEKIRVWSRFQIADIGFYPELNYFTWVAINEYGWA